ncbi:MAG: hypothetical protein JST04_15115 [Bdellovibrionales bacterium]|nr:hypothetical protein [Bdellovibrionales bacterium]
MRLSILASLVSAAFSVSALASEKPGDLVAYLVKQMGGAEAHLGGRTDIMTDCAIDFVANGDRLIATYSDIDGSRRNVRGLFEVKAKTRVKKLDEKARTATVENEYVENLGNGKTRKSVYRARLEIRTDNRGQVTFVNVGWNSDRGEPFMYGCAIQ